MNQEYFFNIFKGLKRKSQQQNQGEYVTERMLSRVQNIYYLILC